MGRARVSLLVVCGACGLFPDVSSLSSDAGGVDASADVSADVASVDVGVDVAPDAPREAATDAGDGGLACPDAHGPTMVAIPSDGFCIDSTEVTNDQYTAFLASSPGNTLAQCNWNSSFVPAGTWPPASGRGSFPVGGVDWCDAYAYCAWAGKRLCGKIGGGSVPPASYTDPTVSQWTAACTRDGTRLFPYGNVYIAGACNDVTIDAGVAAVATFPQCNGGFAGIFDMVGNLDEWEDSCSPAADGGAAYDLCNLRGEAYTDTGSTKTCAAPESHFRSDTTQGDPASFRCCWP